MDNFSFYSFIIGYFTCYSIHFIADMIYENSLKRRKTK